VEREGVMDSDSGDDGTNEVRLDDWDEKSEKKNDQSPGLD